MQDIVLIGLGHMGEKIVYYMQNLLKDRLRMLDEQKKSNITLHFITFPLTSPFDYEQYSRRIFELVKDSYSRQNNEKFIYIVVGNLGEAPVGLQVIDIGYMFELLQKDGLLGKKESIAYLTFSDLIGFSSESSVEKEGIGVINKYFETITEYAEKKKYIPPYKNMDGMDFGEINTIGPYDRNYIFITPGDNEQINMITVYVFAEKIFYEIYFLEDIFNTMYKQVQGSRLDAKSEHIFSTFSFVQVPRLEELQHYYLYYLFQQTILDINLQKEDQSINLDYYKKEFFKGIEFDIDNPDFPVERMVNLFIKKHVSHFTNILKPYVGEGNFNHYADECMQRIQNVINAIEPKFNTFLSDELDILEENIKKIVTDLFNVRPLLGHFSLYNELITSLVLYIENWIESVKRCLSEIKTFSLQPFLDGAYKEIEKLNKNKFFNFILFRPIKCEKIKRILNSIPFETWIKKEVEKRLVSLLTESFFYRDGENSRLDTIRNYASILTHFIEYISKKRENIQEQIVYIENVLSFYYVVTYEKQEKFETILKKIEGKSFSIHNKNKFQEYARGFFSTWLKDKDTIHDILYNSESYIDLLGDYALNKGSHLFDIERNIDKEEIFARGVEKEVEKRLENLTSKSFFTISRNFLSDISIILNPLIKREDPLSLQIHVFSRQKNIQIIDVDPKFTLGSIIFIKEYLYMPFSDLVKKDILQKYADIDIHANNEKYYTAIETDTEKTGDKENIEQPDGLHKYIRAIIKEYYPEPVKKMLYKNMYGSEKEELSNEDIDSMSMNADLKTVLNLVSEADLRNIAREYDAVIARDREKTIKMIERNIMRALNKKK